MGQRKRAWRNGGETFEMLSYEGGFPVNVILLMEMMIELRLEIAFTW